MKNDRGPVPFMNVVAMLAGVLGLAAMWATALALWPRLPERIPVHFDLAGRPDRWARTSFLGWFGLPLTFSGMGMLFALVGAFVRRAVVRRPQLLNVPYKAAFVNLPVEARLRAVRPLGALLWGMPGLFALISVRLQTYAYAIARDGEAADASGLVFTLAAIAATLVWTGCCILWTARAIRAEAARAPVP